MADWKLKFFGAMFAVTVLFSGTAQAQIFGSIETASFTAKAHANLDNMTVMKINSTIAASATAPYFKTLPATRGWLWRIITNPGATAPTDDYDLYIVDIETDADILNGGGLNRDTATSEVAYPTQGSGQWEPVYITGPSYFSISGNLQEGALLDTYLYILKDQP